MKEPLPLEAFVGADAAQLLHEDCPVPELSRPLPVGEAVNVDMNGVELRERCVAAFHVVRVQRQADEDPLAVALGPYQVTVGVEPVHLPSCVSRPIDPRTNLPDWNRGRA